jgi:hypothetical protein
MEIYKELAQLHQSKAKRFRIKKYLLACCGQHINYRSSGNLKKAISVAKQFIIGRATWRQFHGCEWTLEGEAFSIELYRSGMKQNFLQPDIEMLNDLRAIRICKHLSHNEAISYLERLAYFVVYVISYCNHTDNGLPSEKYDQFLNPLLFKKYFKQKAI